MNKTLINYQVNFRNAKVLIIESSDDQWAVINQAWQHCMSEIKFVRAATFQAAMDLLTEWHHQEWEIPKLILLDLDTLSLKSGWQFLKWIKAMPSTLNLIPAIILGASSEQSLITESYSLGASSYIVRPVSLVDWLKLFGALRTYWWETNTLPPLNYGK